MFSSFLMLWGAAGHFLSSILHVSIFVSSMSMLSPSYGSHRNVVVHSDHSLFHSVHAYCAFILLAEPCFVLGWSPVITILSRTKVWGLLCFLNKWAMEITRFYEKEWSYMVSSVLLCMVSSVIEWVEACFAVLTLWFAVCAYFSLVWTSLGGIGYELAW